MKWIKTKDALPEDDRDVLVYRKENDNCDVCFHDDDGWWMDGFEELIRDVTHWAEITLPPASAEATADKEVEASCPHTESTAVDEDGCCISCGEDLNHFAPVNESEVES